MATSVPKWLVISTKKNTPKFSLNQGQGGNRREKNLAGLGLGSFFFWRPMRSIHKTMSEILPLLASPEGKNQSGTTVPFLFWCFLRAPRLVNLPPFFAPEQQANLCGVLEGNQKRAASQTPKVGGWFSKEPPFFFQGQRNV